ncbi:MAG: S41 family peptidase [Bacteroidota bacterium]
MMTLSKRKWRYPIFLSLLLVGLIAASQLQDKYFKLNKNLEIFVGILKELDLYYVEDINPDVIVKIGIDAMLGALDPYTSFLPEEDLENFKTFTTGEYGGIGAIIGTRKGKNMVMMLYKDCPAHQGGLRVGDEIVQINGEEMKDKPLPHISSLLKGMPGTSVQVAVARYGIKKPVEVTLTREQVTLKNVPYYGQLQPGIGYIRLANFAMHATDEVRAALESLKESGVQTLILDLRGNPGGILEEAIGVVNLFIDQDLPVVATKSKVAALTKSYPTTQPAYDKAMPVIALIDQKSASAAEIVAGVLQDYDRGVLIGKSTFGKGLVQTTRPLSYNTQLKLTTSKYYIPSGRSIQKIDYSRQRQEKVIEETAEVPKKVFKTKAGRKVYDGNGIAPDIEAEKLSVAPITLSLLEKGLIFDYAVVFQVQHAHIQSAKDFVLSNKEYERFVAWLKDKDYAYTIEPRIEQLLQQAQGEAYTADIQKQITSLKNQVQRQKAADLQKFKAEIKLLLQEAIIMGYYFQEGAIEAMLPHDQAVQKACALFKDMPQYDQLLKATM